MFPSVSHIVTIVNPDDPVLRDYRDLTDVSLRRLREPAEGLYLAESSKVIARAIEAGHRPRSVLLLERWLPALEQLLEPFDIPIYVGDSETLESITGFTMLSGAHRVVIIEDVVDHTNVGAIFRTAAGLGADAVLVTPRCADPLYRRSVRVSMGTVLQLPWTRLPEWPEAVGLLHDAGFTIVALALAADAIPLDDFARTAPSRVAIVLGTEGDGLSRNAMRGADVTVTIPMLHGVDSLNVAAASAVALWALPR